ncbi:MAG TPA: hypothetical protein VK465_07920 [Fibrobacteria bacterium]|nr:hypothetical protein [Fibrobacteria bacterium]
MSILFGVMEEEEERLKQVLLLYGERLEKLPKGSLRLRRRGDKTYVYLQYRDGKRVRTRYVGIEGTSEVKALRKQLMERKAVLGFLRSAKTDLRILARVRRAKRKG